MASVWGFIVLAIRNNSLAPVKDFRKSAVVPVHNYSGIFVQQLPEAKRKLEIPDVTVLTNPYTITNVDPPLRVFDAQTASLPDTRDVLATLITDLQAAGVIP